MYPIDDFVFSSVLKVEKEVVLVVQVQVTVAEGAWRLMVILISPPDVLRAEPCGCEE